MNADALLRRQGWRGKGFSLDKKGQGLSKPLLVKHKLGSSGLGSQKDDFGNQWWLKAWDKPLSDVPNIHEASLEASKPTTSNPRLYSSFVKAEPLAGTLTSTPKTLAKDPSSLLAERNHKETAADMVEASSPKEKANKKRKHVEEVDHAELPVREKKRPRSHYKTRGSVNGDILLEGPSEAGTMNTNGVPNGISFPAADAQTGEQAYERRQKVPQEKKKLRPREVRAERMKARQEKARVNARRNREHSKLATGANAIKPDNYKEEKLSQKDKLPLHPESITAMRLRGEQFELPNPPMPPKDSRVWFTKDNEPAPNMPAYVHEKILADAERYQKKGGINPLADDGNQRKKKSYKADKYERERIKRQMKREWRFWQEVRQNPDDYRPDGTRITRRDRGLQPARRPKEPEVPGENGEEVEIPPSDALNGRKLKKTKEKKKETPLEKQARRELKEKMKVERRVARKMIRAEKKQANHKAMQAHISAKLKAQRHEAEEKLAAEQGLTWIEWQRKIKADKAVKRRERQQRQAESAGLSIEEFRTKQQAEHKKQADFRERDFAKEARELGISVEEYLNQDAEVNDSELGSDLEIEGGLRDGTGEHFGRSPIDRLWAKHKAEEASKEHSKGQSQHGSSEQSEATHLLLGATVPAEIEHDDSSSEASSSDSDSESNGSSSSSGDSCSDNGVSLVAPAAEVADRASASADFIPLDAEPPTTTISASNTMVIPDSNEDGGVPLTFTSDTTGDPSLPLKTRKLVKDMTKAERLARLSAIRARRIERASAAGVTKLSKKARRAARAKRKETLLLKMTQDIISRRKAGTYNRYNGDAGPMPGVPEPAYDPQLPPTPREDGKKVKDRRSAESKSQFKQARREARRIMRNMKKGKLLDHEIPEGWEGLPRRKTPKLRGNGGRIPKKVNR